MGAVAFFECSAKNKSDRQSINIIFETAITSAATAVQSNLSKTAGCECVITVSYDKNKEF